MSKLFAEIRKHVEANLDAPGNPRAYKPDFYQADSDRKLLLEAIDVMHEALKHAGGQLGQPNIGDACASACKTISSALARVASLEGK